MISRTQPRSRNVHVRRASAELVGAAATLPLGRQKMDAKSNMAKALTALQQELDPRTIRLRGNGRRGSARR